MKSQAADRLGAPVLPKLALHVKIGIRLHWVTLNTALHAAPALARRSAMTVVRACARRRVF